MPQMLPFEAVLDALNDIPFEAVLGASNDIPFEAVLGASNATICRHYCFSAASIAIPSEASNSGPQM